MNCQKCNQEFTKEDEAAGNYRKSYGGGYSHRLCPNTACFVCGKEIKSTNEAIQSAALVWRHKSCKPDIKEAKRRIAAEPTKEIKGEDLFAKL